ncbi:MAG: 4Fe-4S binding protein [Calditrichaeota bacterium]|nr:4Fe-4S binding protein [Calditrichota bacterium]
MVDPVRHLNNHLHLYRRISQCLVMAAIILIPVLNTFQVNTVIGTFYSLTIGHLTVMDPALLIQLVLLTGKLAFPWLLAAAIPFLMAAFLGKVFCSWMCPFNLLGEWAQHLRRRIGKPAPPLRFFNPPAIRYWMILAGLFLILAILGIPLINFISMPGLISAQIADLIVNKTLGIEVALVFIILLLEMATRSRFWCKYLCPVGATLALPMHRHTLRVAYSPQKCEACTVRGPHKPCGNACPFHLDPRRPDIYPYCYNCGECVAACQQRGQALRLTFTPTRKIKRQSPARIIENTD